MVGGGAEDRCEVKAGDPHGLQVIQTIDHPEQIAPLKARFARRCAPGIQCQMLLGLHSAAAAEPIRKDLVNHSIRNPGGGVVEGSGSTHCFAACDPLASRGETRRLWQISLSC